MESQEIKKRKKVKKDGTELQVKQYYQRCKDNDEEKEKLMSKKNKSMKGLTENKINDIQRSQEK